MLSEQTELLPSYECVLLLLQFLFTKVCNSNSGELFSTLWHACCTITISLSNNHSGSLCLVVHVFWVLIYWTLSCFVQIAEMVLSTYEKQRILYHHRNGLRPSEILSVLRAEDITTCRQTISRFILRFIALSRKEGSGRPTVITERVLELVEREMQSDDETTATQLHVLLTSCEIRISFSTILRSHSMLGWTFRGSKYCQLIRPRNKFKRLQWAVTNLPELLTGGFEDVIWTDETSVQLESHQRHSYWKKGEPATLKPRPKHPTKLHVWGGISKRGRTRVVIFDGTMDATLYIKVLQHELLPFIQETYPDSHRLMQDNDPKHASKKVAEFFAQSEINWWKPPAESPDLNPIENLWHELKEYIRREVKPSNKAELLCGIKQFWGTVDVQKCCKYINHLRKVISRVIELEGAATDY